MIKTQSKQKIGKLIVAGFILAVTLAQISYVQSTFLNQYFNLEVVSLIFLLAYICSFIIMNEYPNLIAKFNNLNCVLALLSLEIISLLLLIFFSNPIIILLAFIIYILCINLVFINFDIFLEVYTSDANTGRIRGVFMTIYNLGWVISPIISGAILEKFGFNWLFGLVICLTLPIILILLSSFQHFKNHYNHKKYKIVATIKELAQHHNLKKIFYIAFLLQVFYAIMVIYTPIYLNQIMGLEWKQIGLIFSIMLIPFVIVEYPAGYLADKYLGEKELLTLGLVITIISVLIIFLIKTPGIFIWAAILFCSRIGASLIEIMRDTYFFKKVPVEKIELINAFRSTMPLAYIFTPIIAGLVLFYLPMNYLFLTLAIIMSSGLYFSLTLKDTK